MIPHPVGVPPDVDDVAVVHETVDEGRRHDFVAEHAPQSSKPLFEVSTVDALSCRALMSWKKSTAPSWLTGM